MKKTLSTLWLLLVAALFITSCQEEENVNDIPGVSQSTWTTGVTIAADATSAEYTFQAAGAWIASSQQSWCSVTSKGQAGASTLTLTFEPNTSREDRTTLISIAFTDGYKGDSFVVTQEGDPSGQDPTEEGPLVNQYFDEFLSYYYLWNTEYKAMERDFSTPYVDDYENNFFVQSLLRLGRTTGANNLDYKNGTLYSYVTRTAGTRTASTRATDGEIDHSQYGIEKEQTLSYGIAGVTLTKFSETEFGITLQSVYPNSSAAQAGLERGDMIMAVNGQRMTTQSTAYNLAMNIWLSTAGSTVKLTLYDGEEVSLTATHIYPTPVLAEEVFEVGGTRIGYLNYSGFDAAYDNDLLHALRDLKAQGISELILDLRYNGGGHVMSANMLSTVIAGSQADGQVFAYYRYNDDRMADVKGTADETGMEYVEAVDRFKEEFYYGDYDGADLSREGLGLQRLYVLTTASTASASELVINSLRGIGIDVVTVGETSNGKNVGMEGTYFDLEGYTYEMFPITFQSYNADNYSIPATGVTPDIAAADWDDNNGYMPFGPDEPLIAAAIEDITGVTATAATKAAKATPLRAQRIDLAAPVRQHPQGMIVLRNTPFESGER